MKNKFWQHTYGFILAAAFTAVVTVYGLWYAEELPYLELDAKIVKPVSFGDEYLNIDVNVVRSKLCPYKIEREVIGSDAVKYFDELASFITPDKVGREMFSAPIRLSAPIKSPEIFYQVRIGAMCNPLQRVFPNWTSWIRSSVKVQEKSS